jgi:membrane dipeptidase
VTELQLKASDLLQRFPLVDGHNDLPWALRERSPDGLAAVNLAGPVTGTHTDLPRLRAGGVGAQFWSVYVPASLAGHSAVTTVLEQIDLARRMIARYPQALELALTTRDVERIFASGRIASLLGAEGGHAIAGSLGVLRMLYALGVRYMTLTARLAGNGGVCMVTFVPAFVSQQCADWLAELKAEASHRGLDPRDFGQLSSLRTEWQAAHPPPRATLAQAADHIEHVRQVAGVQHVGIGGDFDGTQDVTVGLEDVSAYPALFAELLARGWSESDCAALAGGNLLRVLGEAESFAARG